MYVRHYLLPEGPKNLTMNSFKPPKIVTSCLLSILRGREGGRMGEKERKEGEEADDRDINYPCVLTLGKETAVLN